jgi:hypothetical protein
MECLSNDLIAYVGGYLPLEDRRKCLETGKIFKDITTKFTFHELTFVDDNINVRLKRLGQTLEYLYKIKPGLCQIVLKFKKITTCDSVGDLARVITNKHVCLSFELCEESAIYKILSWFRPDVLVDIRKHIKSIGGDEAFLQLPGLVRLITIISGSNPNSIDSVIPKIGHISELGLDCYHLQHVNLEHIDITKNKCLYVRLSGSDMRIQDIHKVTALEFGNISLNGYYKLYDCIKASTERKETFRLHTVVLNKGMCERMLSCLRILPLCKQYHVTPKDASIVWVLAKLFEVTKTRDVIFYHCENRSEYLRACLLKKANSLYDFHISEQGLYQPTERDMRMLCTVDDIYGEMSEVDKKEWFTVYTFAHREL